MSRDNLIYNQARGGSASEGAFDPDMPVIGLYRMRLAKGAPDVGIRIWYGPPLDPYTREELDRGWRYQATANGDDISIERVWPMCAKTPVDEPEYRRLVALQQWGKANNVEAFANPKRGTSLLQSPLPF